MPTLIQMSRDRLRSAWAGERLARRIRAQNTLTSTADVAQALREALPHVALPDAPRHQTLWTWAGALQPGTKPPAFLACWPRGGAKSTSAELIAVWALRSLRRRFALYVSGTQLQADMHLQTVANHLERAGEERALNAYGQSRGWTGQMLRTARGGNALSIGLDGNVRGAKLDELRPDLIILDDVDDRHDSEFLTAKKLRILTRTILPAGSADCAVLFVQNRIHEGSVLAQLLDGRADALLDRVVSSEPAVRGLAVERVQTPDGPRYRVTGGDPTWPEGQGLTVCEGQINEWGLEGFCSESQHEDVGGGGIWDGERDIAPYRVGAAPALRRIVIGVDPPGGATECGIVAAGLGSDGRIYVLRDASLLPASAGQWAEAVRAAYHDLHVDGVVAERNYGGDMVAEVLRGLPVKLVNASRGKAVRAEPVQFHYQQGKVAHVGVFPALEREMTRWRPGIPSPNRLDALVWACTALLDAPVPAILAQASAKGWQR